MGRALKMVSLAAVKNIIKDEFNDFIFLEVEKSDKAIDKKSLIALRNDIVKLIVENSI